MLEKTYLNTSHVNVNHIHPIPLKQFFLNLNTSHVNVNLKCEGVKEYDEII